MKNLKACQETLLDLLKTVDQTCRQHNIEYWIDGGTLLGAARSGSFIPWDDDLDICLLPDDHTKLIHLLRSEVIPKNKKLLLFSDHRPKIYWSEYFGDVSVLKNGTNPYEIDILMMKSVPNIESEIKKDKSLINIASLYNFYRYKHREEVLPEHKKKFLQTGFFLFRRNNFAKYFVETHLKGLNQKNPDHLYNYPYNDMFVKRDREYYSYDDIFPLKEIEFEGIKFWGPNNVDSYLSKLYGPNYMTPPGPEHQKPSAKKITINTNSPAFTKRKLAIIYYLKWIKNAWLAFRTKK